MRSIRAVLSTAAVAALLPAAGHATNGYFAHGFGIKSRAMAGTGTAHALGSSAAAINPAGMVHVGNDLELAVELFSPRRQFTVTGMPSFDPDASVAPPLVFPLNPGKVESDKELFAIPTLGWNRMIGENSTVGITIYGQGGMNTSYDHPVFGAGPAGVDLSQMFIAPTYARKLSPRFSVGVSPILAVQRFEAKGVASFAPLSASAGDLSDNGHETSFGGGVRLGVQGAVTPELRVGASWKSRIHMEKLDDYAGLFAGHGGFDVPSSFNVGVSWQASATSLLQFDVEHINYSEVDSVSAHLLPNLGTARLGDSGGAGFGWSDMTVFKLGGAWQANGDWSLRAGLSYGKQPIPESEVLFNILAPGVQEWHFTTGITRRIGRHGELDLGVMYSPAETVTGANPLNTGQTIELKMHQLSAQIGYTVRL